jgi:hypothetical protein
MYLDNYSSEVTKQVINLVKIVERGGTTISIHSSTKNGAHNKI